MKEKSKRFCELQDNVNWIDIYVTVILRVEKKKWSYITVMIFISCLKSLTPRPKMLNKTQQKKQRKNHDKMHHSQFE